MSSTALKTFFEQSQFAVVGASTNRAKFGNKVLRWFTDRSLEVRPVHPSEAQIEGVDCLKDLRDLPSPSTTSLEVITPPAITLKVLNTAKELGTPSIWLQPGAEDAAVVQYIRDEKLEDRVIYGGPCILVLGDRLRAEAKL